MRNLFKLIVIGSFTVAFVGCKSQAPQPARDTATPSAMEVVRLDPALDALIAPGTPIEKVATGFKFTEGPMWRGGLLWFSDVVGNRMYTVTPDGKVTLMIEHSGGVDNPPAGAIMGSNAMATDKDGSVLMEQHGLRRIVRLQGDSPDQIKMTPVLDKFEGKRFNSPNDLVFAPDGTLWFTDPPYGLVGGDNDPAKELKFNGVFHYARGKLTAAIKDLTRPNGIGFTADGKTLYISNTEPDMYVVKYQVAADGTVSNPIKVISYSGTKPDSPDGLKLDSADNLWTTGPGGIRIISPAGKVLGQIKLPEVAANLAWAGDGTTLYITASTSIYRLKVKTPGKMPLYQK